MNNTTGMPVCVCVFVGQVICGINHFPKSPENYMTSRQYYPEGDIKQ